MPNNPFKKAAAPSSYPTSARTLTLLCFLLLVPLAATASEHYATGEGPESVTRAYSRAAHLLPLQASDDDTLRVWTRDYMSGRVQGYIVTRATAMSCHAASSYTDGSITVGHIRCRTSSTPAAAKDVLGTLPAFSRQEWNCPAFDGGEVFIEGVRQHRHFAVRVGNPQACDDAESKAIVELLGKLG